MFIGIKVHKGKEFRELLVGNFLESIIQETGEGTVEMVTLLYICFSTISQQANCSFLNFIDKNKS